MVNEKNHSQECGNMDTHRYVRPLASAGNNDDRYNIQIKRQRIESDNREYWTNGKTTLLFGIPRQSKLPQKPTPASLKVSVSATPPIVPSVPSSSESSRRRVKRQVQSPKGTSANDVIRRSFLAGSFAGVCATTLCYPFEMLRLRMQQSPPSPRSAMIQMVSAGCAARYNHALQYGGGGGGGSLPTGSVRALYSGLSLKSVLHHALHRATIFTVNNVAQHALVDWKTRENYKLGVFQPHQITLADHFVCGFMAGAVNGALFVTPFEYVRNQYLSQQQQQQQQQQLHSQKQKWQGPGARGVSTNVRMGIIRICLTTIRSDGVKGFWRGLVPTVIRDSIGCGCFFAVLAYSQQQLTKLKSSDGESILLASSSTSSTTQSELLHPSGATVFLSGGLAGLAYWLWSLPVDTMKTWIQNGRARDIQHALEITMESGLPKSIPSLFRGWKVVYGRRIPAAAVSVTAYTYLYHYLNAAADHSK